MNGQELASPRLSAREKLTYFFLGQSSSGFPAKHGGTIIVPSFFFATNKFLPEFARVFRIAAVSTLRRRRAFSVHVRKIQFMHNLAYTQS